MATTIATTAPYSFSPSVGQQTFMRGRDAIYSLESRIEVLPTSPSTPEEYLANKKEIAIIQQQIEDIVTGVGRDPKPSLSRKLREKAALLDRSTKAVIKVTARKIETALSPLATVYDIQQAQRRENISPSTRQTLEARKRELLQTGRGGGFNDYLEAGGPKRQAPGVDIAQLLATDGDIASANWPEAPSPASSSPPGTPRTTSPVPEAKPKAKESSGIFASLIAGLLALLSMLIFWK